MSGLAARSGPAANGLRFGIATGQNVGFDTLVERWRRYEELGFDDVWACDHFNQPSQPSGPYFEGWTVLAALAARTSRVRVGVLVTCNTFRHPALLAQQAITVDHVSRGRLELGIGSGWFEPEHRRFGIPLPAPRELVARLDESLTIIDSLLREQTTSFAGRYYRLDEARLRPGPVQKPRPPITIGAHKPGMLKLCATYADTWNSYGSVEEIEQRGAVIGERCEEIGRAPAEISRSLYCWRSEMQRHGLPGPWDSRDAFEDVVGRYREVGIDSFIFDQPTAEEVPVMEQVAADVIPRLRGDAVS